MINTVVIDPEQKPVYNPPDEAITSSHHFNYNFDNQKNEFQPKILAGNNNNIKLQQNPFNSHFHIYRMNLTRTITQYVTIANNQKHVIWMYSSDHKTWALKVW